MDYNWIKIYSTSELFKIEILKGFLKGNNITPISINKQDSSCLEFRDIELFVDAKDVIQAKILIKKTK